MPAVVYTHTRARARARAHRHTDTHTHTHTHTQSRVTALLTVKVSFPGAARADSLGERVARSASPPHGLLSPPLSPSGRLLLLLLPAHRALCLGGRYQVSRPDTMSLGKYPSSFAGCYVLGDRRLVSPVYPGF